jgi:hypothetical protein
MKVHNYEKSPLEVELILKVKLYKHWTSIKDFYLELDQFNDSNKEVIEVEVVKGKVLAKE